MKGNHNDCRVCLLFALFFKRKLINESFIIKSNNRTMHLNQLWHRDLGDRQTDNDNDEHTQTKTEHQEMDDSDYLPSLTLVGSHSRVLINFSVNIQSFCWILTDVCNRGTRVWWHLSSCKEGGCVQSRICVSGVRFHSDHNDFRCWLLTESDSCFQTSFAAMRRLNSLPSASLRPDLLLPWLLSSFQW
jgi:hypothetical protein